MDIEAKARELLDTISPDYMTDAAFAHVVVALRSIARAAREELLREARMYVLANTGREDRTEPVTPLELIGHLVTTLEPPHADR